MSIARRLRLALGATLGLTLALLALALGALALLSPGTTAPILGPDGNPLPGSVADAQALPLGGVDQFVLIRGRSTSDPVLLLLHGGPGNPQAALFRYYNTDLEDHFVVVNWDQRGAGGSYSRSIPPESMTVDQLVSDAHELTQVLKEQFGRERIILAGHSWGSYLGMRIIDRFPEDYWAYVGIGQVANQQQSEALSYRIVLERARAAGNQSAVRELESVGPPERGRYRGWLEGLGTQRRWVREYGGAAHGMTNLGALWLFAKPLLLFPEYRVRDKLSYLAGESFSMEHLEGPMLDDDLTQSITDVSVPVFFFQGRHDLQTVFELSRRYHEQLRAPHKEFVVFEESAHLVPYEEPEAFLRAMVERVRPLAIE